ncbi:uncharacterized protein F5891DRAFT_1192203 [Suillus fuscotomentosus]|uniref:Uncharacterized protein n=1 Tax=Suillus fuscotomentosus TaxID=1912939 RepID=A0AAD4E0T5_9AGAM|nr:uncharacterized protein F5891DRAFT_1192203 [Suillus fuscotomentosus]KAG1897257.1 hypothetical protein F5891DRAFT_1192203 [Suillus fuscotomentosus]
MQIKGVVSTGSALTKAGFLVFGPVGFIAPIGVASSAPGIEGIRINTTSLYKQMGVSTEYAGEGARGVPSPGGAETV